MSCFSYAIPNSQLELSAYISEIAMNAVLN